MTRSYVVSFYEMDREYGGPEEGGWWFNTGQFVRSFKVAKTEEEAITVCRRANRLLTRLRRGQSDIYSMGYGGGEHRAMIHEDAAPASFPTERPYYC